MYQRTARIGAIAIVVVLVASLAAAVVLSQSSTSSASGRSDSPSASATFSLSATPPKYSVSFDEAGLPNGTWWGVTFNGTSLTTPGDPTISFSVTNGTYAFNDTAVGYNGTPMRGTVMVHGAPRTIEISFSNHTTAYPVAFTEEGLPSGTLWNVTLNGSLSPSTSPTITFAESNGTYPYAVGAIPGYTTAYTGTIRVDGASVDEPVAYAPFVYAVTFEASGLPAGIAWSVGIADLTVNSTGPILSVQLPNGTYGYAPTATDGYASSGPGSLVVSGSALEVTVNFTQTTYAVTFTESGLPSGVGWRVEFGSQQAISTTPNVTFQAANGSYVAAFSAGGDYSVSPATMPINVSGAPTGGHVTFTAIPFAVNFTETGLGSGVWTVALNGTSESGPAGGPISFHVPDGRYSYQIGAVPGYTTAWYGTVYVSGADQNVSVAFVAVQYLAVLSATGLPSGVGWSVSVAGQSENVTGPSVSFELVNGTYAFSTLSLNLSWQTLDPFGNLTVDGSNVALTVLFGFAYDATFNASGLPPGVSWTINVTGAASTANASAARALAGGSTGVRYSYTSFVAQFEIPLPNGTYTYSASSSSPSWIPQVEATPLVVHGAPPPMQTVTPTSGVPAPTPSGPASYLFQIVLVVVVVAAAAVGAVSYRQVSRRRQPTTLPGFDALYGSYELATDVDLAGGAASGDPLDDIF